MPYIGKQPLTGAYQLCDTITTSATATYNLLVGGSAVIPGSANNCIVSLNGVVQAPVGAFTVSGSTITFASTLSATDVIDFILILGNVFDIGTPTNGAVTNSSLNSNVITGQTAETTIAGGDSVLIYDDSASALRKMTRTNFVSGLNNTPAFSATRSTGNTLTLNTDTLIVFDSEQFDTNNAYSTSTGKFIVPSGQAGKYFFTSSVAMAASYCGFTIFIAKNGSFNRGSSVRNDASTLSISIVLDLAVADEIEVFVNADFSQQITSSYFMGFKLI